VALRQYPNLTQEEVFRGELQALHTMLALVIRTALLTHEKPDDVYREFETAIAQIVPMLKVEAIDTEKQQPYRKLVAERASEILTTAKKIVRGAPGRPN
jgi:hypothetical protein